MKIVMLVTAVALLLWGVIAGVSAFFFPSSPEWVYSGLLTSPFALIASLGYFHYKNQEKLE